MTDTAVWGDAGAWSLDPQVLAMAAVGVALYARGARVLRPGRLHVAAFAGSVAAILLALLSPLDELAQSLFAAHMLQHMFLLVVAPPLLLASAPLPALWEGVPEVIRPALRQVGATARRLPTRTRGALWSPWTALVLFAGDVWAWHLPAAYELSLRSETVHDLEHTTFLVVGLVYFAHAVDSPPLASRLGPLQRAGLLLGGVLASWALSLALVFARTPLYPTYAHLASRPGGGGALADQQLGAGLMWGPGMLPFYALVLVCLRRWLGAEERRGGAAVSSPAA